MTSTVTAAAVSKNFGAYQDAAVREPVITPRMVDRAPCCL
ncbi:Prevent host death protein, Phd antitoxin (plasmid) [Sinorhizobium fredii CCBAU 83666]|nr:Prevent host death protein, Phd antitoxin [Sinorhizobium fredii CCBAU 83666]